MELYVRGRCCMHSRMSRGYIFSPILDWGELAWDNPTQQSPSYSKHSC